MTGRRPTEGHLVGPRLRAVTAADVDGVLELWETSLPARYRLRTDVLELSLAADASTAIAAAVAEVDGRIVGFALAGATAAGAAELGPLRGVAWLQAVVVAPEWRRRGVGRALVRAVLEDLGRSGASRVQAGGGLFYFWPGVPDDLPEAGPFLRAVGFGFVEGVAWDLRGDVSAIRLDAAATGALAAAGTTVVPASSADRVQLLAFILGEFGPEWWHDTGFFLDRGGDPAEVLLLVDREGTIRGFVRIHSERSRPPGWPIYWRAGSTGCGGLGPIGVARALRGRGLGRALLVAALDHLRRIGASDVVIDDTTLLGYYGPHGFAPWITYRHAFAPLGPLLAPPGALSREDP